MDSGRVERKVEDLLARPLGWDAKKLGALLTDCAAVALQLRAAIRGGPGDRGEMESLSASSARISELMGEIRRRLDRITPRP